MLSLIFPLLLRRLFRLEDTEEEEIEDTECLGSLNGTEELAPAVGAVGDDELGELLVWGDGVCG